MWSHFGEISVGQTLIRQRHDYAELGRHKSHTHTLVHTSSSALFITRTTTYLSHCVHFVPRVLLGIIPESILCRNLPGEHCWVYYWPISSLLACNHGINIDFCYQIFSLTSHLCDLFLCWGLWAALCWKLNCFWGFFSRFRLRKPWRYPSLQLYRSSAHPARALWEVSHVRPNKR